MAVNTRTIDPVDYSDRNQMLWRISEQALAEAAAFISSLSQCETRMELQSLGMIEINEAVRLFDENNPEIVAVSQQLQGAIDGHALFMLQEASSIAWLRQMLNERARLKDLTQMEEESLAELGNIILNSCLANYMDLLQGPLASQLPQLTRGHYTQLLQGVSEDISNDDLFYLLVNLSSQNISCQACILWTRLSWDDDA